MSRRAAAPSRPGSRSNTPTERDLLARLGLSGTPSGDEVEAAHADLIEFLDSAPHDLRGWARAQVAAADEAYALLSDRGAALAPQSAADEYLADEDVPAVHQRTSARAARRTSAAARETDQPRQLQLGRFGRALTAAAALFAVLAVGYIVYASDAPAVPRLSGTPAPEGSTPVLDTARVAELMGRVQADATDVVALQELGDLFFQAGDYAAAIEWENKVLAILPNDPTAHLAIGAAEYNRGDAAAAEEHWRLVLETDPDNLEAHYDLGFLYFRQEPPNVEQTIAEWRRVIEIAPESAVAQTVAAHLDTLEQWQASASPGGSPGPSSTPSPAPAGSPSPSPSPSGGP